MKTRLKSSVSATLVFEMSEDEARAFHDIVAYGTDAFLDVFKEKLGKHYIQKHENGLRTLFAAVYEQFPQHLYKIEAARKAFFETNPSLNS